MQKTSSLTIAIDFDDTFTADPELWAGFIKSCIDRNHWVYCVTSRRNTDENINIITKAFNDQGLNVLIVFCNLKSKVKTMEDRGIKVNIWIDDAPHALVYGH